jgi:hypothetical protein
MRRHPADKFRQLFPQEHIAVILLFVLQVGEKLHKQTATDREDWLTTKLYRRIINTRPFRNGPLHIHLQPDIVNADADPETNTPEGRLDLQVYCGRGGYEVYFAIEAKRLRVSLPSRFFPGYREYVEDGMLRFVTGLYAPFMHAGAMLGYVYDGDIQKARSGVAGYIERDAAALSLIGRFVRSSIIPQEPIDETRHAMRNCPFTIYHLFLAI